MKSPTSNLRRNAENAGSHTGSLAASKPIVLAGGELRVVFEWHGDRYAHRIVARNGDGETALLESVEGNDDTPWPPSPPLQQVHVESRGGGVMVALAVGMAGRSHWSVAFELNPVANSLAVDVACRCQQRPERLGSEYQLLMSPPHFDGDRVLIGDWRLVAAHPQIGEKRVNIPAVITKEENPATVRWCYLVEREKAFRNWQTRPSR